ncbi:hypothetical protein TNCV_3038271 [Trichonephila clavipes]|nr:hypothetical protein TNCV_3038271 [Trichonephila clavipes]
MHEQEQGIEELESLEQVQSEERMMRRIRWPPLACKFKASLPSSSGRRARFLGGQKGVALQLQMHVWVSGPQRSGLDVDVLEK